MTASAWSIGHSVTPTTLGRVEGDARARIRRLLLAGDNGLKQGIDHAQVRERWEAALALARAAGLEEATRPLVEVRLADLARLEGESAPAAPTAG